MLKQRISSDWLLSVNGGEYRKVDLPNDFAIDSPRSPDARGGARNGFFNGGIGNYVKYMPLTGNTSYVLDIDGAYMCAQVNINDHTVAFHPHGYAPFLVDITKYLRPDALNKIQGRDLAYRAVLLSEARSWSALGGSRKRHQGDGRRDRYELLGQGYQA